MEVNKENFDNVMNFQRVSDFIKKYDSDGPGSIARQFISKIKSKDTTPEEVVKEMSRYKKHKKIIKNNYKDALHVARFYIAYNKLNQSDKKFISKIRHRYLGESAAKNSCEKEIQNAIENNLKIRQDSGKILYIKNSAATKFIEQADIYTRIQSKRGSPDLLIFMKDVKKDCLRTIGLEVKTVTGKQSPRQIGWKKRFEKLGGEYHIVRSVDDVIKIIEKDLR